MNVTCHTHGTSVVLYPSLENVEVLVQAGTYREWGEAVTAATLESCLVHMLRL